MAQSSAVLDRYDRALLQVLQREGRITNSELAARVSLSESACLRRVRALEAAGLIEGYAAVLNQQRAGCQGGGTVGQGNLETTGWHHGRGAAAGQFVITAHLEAIT